MNISKWVCESCIYYPPSSTDGKPCTQCNPDDPFWSCYSEKSSNDLSQMDIVYFVKDAQTNEELRYSLRSVEKNFPHRNVWFFGGKPRGLEPDKWMNIEQNEKTKWKNTSMLLRKACKSDGVSDSFVLFNDDFYVMQPIESLPYYSDGTLAERVNELKSRHTSGSTYITRLMITEDLLNKRGLPTMNYALHVPMIIKKDEMLQTFDEFPGGEMWRSIYGNHHKKPVVHMKDCKVYNRADDPPTDTVFLSSADTSFRFGKIGAYVRCAFPDKCKYERRENEPI